MGWQVYIAQCADGSLYTGVAIDPGRRLQAHNDGKGSSYIRSRRPAVLVYEQRCRGKSAALRRERAIKRWTRAQKLVLIASVRPGRNGTRRI